MFLLIIATMKMNDSQENEMLRHQFLKEFSTFSDDELIKAHNNYVNFEVLNSFLIMRHDCLRKEFIRRKFDLSAIAIFHANGRLKSFNQKERIFILRINNKKILIPFPRCVN
jgi:hypothetical protein